MGCKRKRNAGLGIRKKKRGKGTPAIPKEIITNRPPSSSQVSEISVASTTSSQESCPKEWYSGTQTRLFIKMLYEKKYQAAPESEWYAEGGTGIISLLLKDIPWTNRTTIKKVLVGSLQASRRKHLYKGTKYIEDGSIDEQIVADFLEDGYGVDRTWRAVNTRRRKKGLVEVGRSVIVSTIKTLQAVQIPIVQVSQGCSDPYSTWAMAGFNQAKQMLVRLGTISPPFNDPPMPPRDDLPTNQVYSNSDPKYFDASELGKLAATQIVFFDETHPKCEITSMARGLGRRVVSRVKKDKHGKVYLNEGSYQNTDPSTLKCKYDKEIRLLLGVAMVEYEDGSIEGKRVKPYSYTEKTILCESEWTTKLRSGILETKALQETQKKRSGWIISSRKEDEIFMDDDIDLIKGISKSKKTILNAEGLVMVKDLVEKLDNEAVRKELVSKVRGVGMASLNKWWTQAKTASAGCCVFVDYTAAENPFQERYGEDWKKKCSFLSRFVLVNDFIDFMFTEAKNVMKGTVHEQDYVVFHDALSLFTGKEPVAYMKEKGYWDKLVRPMLGINDNLKRFENRVVGNHPYLMPLDAHLNQDIHLSHDYHTILTCDLPDNSPLKFSKKTPKNMEAGYLKLWDHTLPKGQGCPSSDRIIHDIKGVLEVAYPKLYQARGIAL